MYVFTEDEKLVKAFNCIWNDVSNSKKEELDSQRTYNKRCLKTEIKSYSDKAHIFTIK